MDSIAHRLIDGLEEKIVSKSIVTCEECPLRRFTTCPEQRHAEPDGETPAAWLIGLASITIIVSPDDERFGVVIPKNSIRVESAIATCNNSGNHIKPGLFRTLFPETHCSFRGMRWL